MPVTWNEQDTPNFDDVRLHAHVALIFALSFPATKDPAPFQVPTRHSMSATGFGSGSATAVRGRAMQRAGMILVRDFMGFLLSHPSRRDERQYAVPFGGT